MSSFPEPYVSHLFTVRIWSEEVAPGQVEWRGLVRDISGGQVHCFRDWPGLTAFLDNIVSGQSNIAQAAPTRAGITPTDPSEDVSAWG